MPATGPGTMKKVFAALPEQGARPCEIRHKLGLRYDTVVGALLGLLESGSVERINTGTRRVNYRPVREA